MGEKADIERIADILCDHFGERLTAGDVEIVPDPEIVDLFAVRVSGQTHFLVRSQTASVEKVQFDAWPPQRVGANSTSRTAREMKNPVSTRRTAMRIENLMCQEVYHCSPEDSLETAARLMWEHDCGCAPVCSADGERKVVGMITDRDIAMCALFEGKPLAQLQVQDAMSRDVGWCGPSDETGDVERLMSERQIRRVPVISAQGKLIGIISLADLVRRAKPKGSRVPDRVTESEIRKTLAGICAPSRGKAAPAMATAAVGA